MKSKRIFLPAGIFNSFSLTFLMVSGGLFLLPVNSAFATSAIASAVMGFCNPEPTVPDVGSCSACHTSTNNRGPNDLNAAGSAALSGNYAFFCPSANQTPTPTPTPPATPTPPPGGPGSSTPGTGMGRGSGAEVDDDDDDSKEEDDDDTPMPAGSSGSLNSLRSLLSDL